MGGRVMRVVVGALVALLLSTGPGAPAGTATVVDRPPAAHRGAPTDGVRVLVWDATSRGIDVWASDRDGTDRRRLHHSSRGYNANLTLSRDGRYVALNPYRSGGPGRLLVVPTDGSRRAVDLLRGADAVIDVGVLDWSPDGRRIAFEGFVDEPSAGLFPPSYLFTIRRDGTGLRRHGRLGDGTDNGQVFGEMTWTRAGIVVPTTGGLVLVDGAQRTTVVADAMDVHHSGDRRWIFFRRPVDHGGGQAVWRVRPNGSDLERVVTGEDGVGDLMGAAPDLRGRHLLNRQYDEGGVRPRMVSFAVADPRETVPVPVPARAWQFAWR